MRKISTIVLFAAVAFLSFAGVAFAAGEVIPPDGSLLDLAKPIYDAVLGGQWWLGAMFGLIFLTTAAKHYLPGKAGRMVNGDVGQPVTVLVLSFAGAAITALMAAGPGAVMSLTLAWAALKIAVGASGGYTLLKQLLAPLLAKLATKAPAWAQPLFTMLLWVFSKPSPVAVAEKAGDAAVEAKPGEGAAAVLGEPKDLS
jgi:hypothetical protein